MGKLKNLKTDIWLGLQEFKAVITKDDEKRFEIAKKQYHESERRVVEAWKDFTPYFKKEKGLAMFVPHSSGYKKRTKTFNSAKDKTEEAFDKVNILNEKRWRKRGDLMQSEAEQTKKEKEQ